MFQQREFCFPLFALCFCIEGRLGLGVGAIIRIIVGVLRGFEICDPDTKLQLWKEHDV
jgi:hypothetical protein